MHLLRVRFSPSPLIVGPVPHRNGAHPHSETWGLSSAEHRERRFDSTIKNPGGQYPTPDWLSEGLAAHGGGHKRLTTIPQFVCPHVPRLAMGAPNAYGWVRFLQGMCGEVW